MKNTPKKKNYKKKKKKNKKKKKKKTKLEAQKVIYPIWNLTNFGLWRLFVFWNTWKNFAFRTNIIRTSRICDSFQQNNQGTQSNVLGLK